MLGRAVALVSVFLLGRCAHQAAPGGGPPDTSPPVVRVCTPENGAVGVATDAIIEIVFSEWISPQNAARSVSMQPSLAGGFDVRVQGRTLRIRPRQRLADSTTYHVEILRTLKDLQGNSLGAPFRVVFSTGPALDSGMLDGCVTNPSKEALQSTVALFRVDDNRADTAFLGFPAYATQTDSFGRFSFEHVRPGVYELIAFDDGNGDGRLQPGREQAYAAIQRPVTVNMSRATVTLYPVACDTTWRRVTECRAVSDRVIVGTWSRPVPRALSKNPVPPMRIVSREGNGHEPRIARYVPLADNRRFALQLVEPLRLAPYYLHYIPIVPRQLADTAVLSDSVRFNGVTVADTVAPRPVSPEIIADRGLAPRVGLVWSEPVRLRSGSGTIALTDSLGDTVRLHSDTMFAETLWFTPLRRLHPGRTYECRLHAGDIEDLSGLHPADSPSVRLRLTTLPADSFCFRLSGRAECLAPDSQRIWMFIARTGGSDRGVFRVREKAGEFRFDTIPGGRGLLWCFVDRDGDGAWSMGELQPWYPPEPILAFRDTIEARSRWEIEGLVLRKCDPCAQGSRQLTP